MKLPVVTEESDTIRLMQNRLNEGDVRSIFEREGPRGQSHSTNGFGSVPVQISDASDFVDIIRVKGLQVGDYRILPEPPYQMLLQPSFVHTGSNKYACLLWLDRG